MAARGRPKKYSAAQFRDAVDRYFRSITAEVQLEGIVDMDGNAIVKTVYVIPPTVAGICLALGIDRRTWANYADPENYGGTAEKPSQYAKVCDGAKLRIEAYLNEQLLSREKSVQGIIFNLSNNFGWSERHEHRQQVELGEETRKVVAQNLTLDEKFALIREAAEEIGRNGEPDDHGGDEE